MYYAAGLAGACRGLLNPRGKDFEMKLKFVAALLAGSAISISAPAWGQAGQPAPAPEQTEPDQSDATADAAIQSAHAVDDAQAKIELLQAQVEALQASIEQIKTAMVKTTPSWKGAPQWDDKDAGFSFKPKGLIQYDAGYTGFPRGNELRGTIAGGLNYANLGWNSRARRLTIGADGTLPGGCLQRADQQCELHPHRVAGVCSRGLLAHSGERASSHRRELPAP